MRNRFKQKYRIVFGNGLWYHHSRTKRKEAFVVLNIAFEYARQELNGLLTTLEGDGLWHCRMIEPRDYHSAAAIRRELLRPTDAIVTDISWSDPSVYEIIAAAGKPVVCIDPSAQAQDGKGPRTRFVMSDGVQIGRMAADTFLDAGVYRSFGFVGARKQYDWSERRGIAFAERLAERGLPCKRFEAPAYNLMSRDELIRFLRTMTPPAAVFAANDERAAEIIDICARARLAVPARIAVLGVDNDELTCRHTSPQLSTIEPDFYGEGCAAAEMLLSAAGVKPGVRVCPAKRVVLRGSTLSRSPHQAFVNRVLAYVNANACNRIGVDDIAAHFRVSRRLLDLRFQENGAGSVLSALMARRIEEAKRRLLSSRRPISQIVEDCGYESLGHFKSVFKRATGMSMRDFRKKPSSAAPAGTS